MMSRSFLLILLVLLNGCAAGLKDDSANQNAFILKATQLERDALSALQQRDSDSRHVLNLFEGALKNFTLMDHLEGQVRVHMHLARYLYSQSVDGYLNHTEEAENLAEIAENQELRFQVALMQYQFTKSERDLLAAQKMAVSDTHKAIVHSYQGNFESVMSLLHRNSNASPSELALLHFLFARANRYNNPDKAIDSIKQSLLLYKKQGDPIGVVDSLFLYSLIAADPLKDEALKQKLLVRAYRVAVALGDKRRISRINTLIGRSVDN